VSGFPWPLQLIFVFVCPPTFPPQRSGEKRVPPHFFLPAPPVPYPAMPSVVSRGSVQQGRFAAPHSPCTMALQILRPAWRQQWFFFSRVVFGFFFFVEPQPQNFFSLVINQCDSSANFSVFSPNTGRWIWTLFPRPSNVLFL